MIEIVEKERYFEDSAFTGQCFMYPTYMVKDGKEYFMFNRREPDDPWKLRENEERKALLISNNGKYFKFHGFYDDPFEMLKEICERRHTFTETEEENYFGSLEEHGFIGCLLIICLFWTILQRGFLIAVKCQDMYGKLLALGLTFSICFQGFLNMWVASSFVPATGVPMPFISYGGSSVMVSLWMIGILLNISKDNVKRVRFGNVRNT